ncbi:hypothetical protein [Chryseobacterium sp. ISL-6]|nr:hypothetical protein [Chryseobacterium sp. ISL-6]
MKTTVLLALCLLSFSSCMPCDLQEDEAKKKNDFKIKSDTLKVE